MTQGQSTNTTAESTEERPPELIDQYTTYVDTTLNVSNRRLRNNRFYTFLLSGTLAVISVLAQTEIIQAVGLLIASGLGVALCVLWYASIRSYSQLNGGKYAVVQEMEEELPFDPFAREWEVLDEGNNWRTYLTHTRVERKIPGVLILPYLALGVYALLQLL
ncbi:hypothetical protein ACFQL9_13190 [Halobaculum lipolyticum]|uniref:Small integral membrane protein n=1 Tax=Halobaculum lipolyticum TaxID=3032001 RepID=A0ABD5WFN8_9EURY